MIKSLLLTGGGSAGHVVPNLALIDAFLARQATVSYIGSTEGIEKVFIIQKYASHVAYYAIACGKLRRYWSLKNFTDVFKILQGIMQAWHIIGKIKPDVVFSKGGFVAFPVVFAAWLRGIPVIAHESDFTPGLANRLSFPFVKKIAMTFPSTKAVFGAKGVLTGTPIRQALFEGNAEKGRAYCGFQNNKKPCILIMGGGSGSAVINQTIRQALPILLNTYNIIHGCGKGHIDIALAHTKGYQQFEYIDEALADCYACADIIISRAGANTVYEILALQKSAIFIPLSLHASRGDQIANARFVESKGLCHVLQESELTSDILIQMIHQTFEQRLEIQQKIKAYGIAYDIQSGTKAIIDLVDNIITKR